MRKERGNKNDDVLFQTLDNYPAAELLSVFNTFIGATQTNCSVPRSSCRCRKTSNISFHSSRTRGHTGAAAHLKFQEGTNFEELGGLCQLFKFNSLQNFYQLKPILLSVILRSNILSPKSRFSPFEEWAF